MSEQNKAVIQRFNDAIMEFFRTGKPDAFDEVLDSSVKIHVPGMPPVDNREAFKQMLGMFRAGMSDIDHKSEDLTAEGDKVAYRASWSAFHTGELMGIPPTGKRVAVTEMHIARLENGKIVEDWGVMDVLGLMQQLGVAPAPGQ